MLIEWEREQMLFNEKHVLIYEIFIQIQTTQRLFGFFFLLISPIWLKQLCRRAGSDWEKFYLYTFKKFI